MNELLEKMISMDPEELLDFIQVACEVAIVRCPTGDIRNTLTEANIILLAKKNEIFNEDPLKGD